MCYIGITLTLWVILEISSERDWLKKPSSFELQILKIPYTVITGAGIRVYGYTVYGYTVYELFTLTHAYVLYGLTYVYRELSSPSWIIRATNDYLSTGFYLCLGDNLNSVYTGLVVMQQNSTNPSISNLQHRLIRVRYQALQIRFVKRNLFWHLCCLLTCNGRKVSTLKRIE